MPTARENLDPSEVARFLGRLSMVQLRQLSRAIGEAAEDRMRRVVPERAEQWRRELDVLRPMSLARAEQYDAAVRVGGQEPMAVQLSALEQILASTED